MAMMAMNTSMIGPPLSARGPGARVLGNAGTSAVNSGVIAALGYTPRPTNALLVKDNVGKSRQSTYDLPDETFAFGKPNNLETEGAREVTMKWVAHTPSVDRDVGLLDFVHFNKKAGMAGITTATDLKYFRKDSDNTSALRSSRKHHFALGKPLIPSDVVPGFSYGVKSRPSTPIREVISARYAERSEQQLEQVYFESSEARLAGTRTVHKIAPTAASKARIALARKARSETEHEEQKDTFKLSKFKHVPAKAVPGAAPEILGLEGQ